MDIVTVAAGALFANMLTVSFFYGVWRLTKRENDYLAMGIVLIVCAVTILLGLSVR